MYKIWWRLRVKLNKVLFDERIAARIRFLFTFFFTFTLVLIGYNLFEEPPQPYWMPELREHFPYLFWIPGIFISLASFVYYAFRHMIMPVAALVGMILASAAYVQDVYELPTFRLGLQYILAAFLGIAYPRLVISEGKAQIPKGEVNLLDAIGGPGYLHIRPGNVVLCESLQAPSSVRSQTFNFISRFESIKEIVSLEDQHGFIEKLGAKTRDGIQIEMHDIHFRYRLRTGRRFGDHHKRRAQDPYPFSTQAVKNMAYNRSVRGGGQMTSWHITVRLAVDGAITDYIKSHKFDQLTAPNFEEADPRADIAKAMNKGIRFRLRNVGAELLWFDIGHFGVSDKIQEVVEAQRVDTWSARWDGDAIVVRSYGEARRLAYQDMGRAEGQADMLLSIIQALEEVGFEEGYTGEDAKEKQRLRNLRAIIWARVAQILDAIADEEQSGSQNVLPPG